MQFIYFIDQSTKYQIAVCCLQGIVVAPHLMTGASDSRHYLHITANGVYRFFPLFMNLTAGEIKRVHGIDERIKVRTSWPVEISTINITAIKGQLPHLPLDCPHPLLCLQVFTAPSNDTRSL